VKEIETPSTFTAGLPGEGRKIVFASSSGVMVLGRLIQEKWRKYQESSFRTYIQDMIMWI
jgi:hypothetical protein